MQDHALLVQGAASLEIENTIMEKLSKKSDDKSLETTPEKAGIDSAEVLDYLRENPGFFVEHPDILELLKIPHPCGEKTISLIERQVLVLRDQMRRQREQFNELMENARKNETLNQQLHKLTLRLISRTSLDEVFSVLHERLTADFAADAVEVRIFLAPRCTTDWKLKEFSDWNGIIPEVMQPLIDASGEPVCVQNRVSQMACLFGEQASTFGSGMLMPLKSEDDGIFGLLGIGSRNPKRFQHTLGTIFMSQLGEIASRIISPYISHIQETNIDTDTNTPDMQDTGTSDTQK
uniref:GAF domain-containing protein n=1 Tax=Candidatus Kentrum sp. TC TaxID=2126339 RepID=A0A451ACL6_9GAMM|nr:MAG: hypothetical protein BECKTC1821E_GA0114239_103613 [Candidatus Kentron sp. TC]VFK51719.1 MAG: hypothetical protein BECKTC1821D_GA0114238_11382 [Candidatus Kentron sp. TC]VFK63753.1 MAG: hypothetical protein BECKTC1821F_GA0114240_110413 [Candidatus Kentron sp. TC]